MANILQLRNLSVITSDGLKERQFIEVKDGVITTQKNETDAPISDAQRDCSGLVAMPACIDMFTPCIVNSQNATEIMEQRKKLFSQGFARITVPSMPGSSFDDPLVLSLLIKESGNDACDLGFMAPMTIGHRGETLSDMSKLVDAGIVGFSNYLDTFAHFLLEINSYRYASQFALPIQVMPAESYLHRNGLAHESSYSTELGLQVIPHIAETIPLQKCLSLGEYTQSKIHIANLSSKYSVEILQNQKTSYSAATSIFHLLFDELAIGNYDTRYKHLPPLRSESDRDSLRAAVNSNLIQVICSNHSPQKECQTFTPFSEGTHGASSASWYLISLWLLAKQGILSYQSIARGISDAPAAILGIESTAIKKDRHAHFVLIDTRKETLITDSHCDPRYNQKIPGKLVSVIKGSEILTIAD